MKPKDIAIASLALALGVTLIWIVFLYKGGGPASSSASSSAANPLPEKPADPQSIPTPQPSPEYDWQDVKNERIVLPLGAFQVGEDISSFGKGVRTKVIVNSKFPVGVGFLPSTYRYSFRQAAQNLAPSFLCLHTQALQTSFTCDLDKEHDYFLLLWDQRPATNQDQVGAALLGAMGYKEPMKEQLARNDVSYTYSEWDCVNNCSH